MGAQNFTLDGSFSGPAAGTARLNFAWQCVAPAGGRCPAAFAAAAAGAATTGDAPVQVISLGGPPAGGAPIAYTIRLAVTDPYTGVTARQSGTVTVTSATLITPTISLDPLSTIVVSASEPAVISSGGTLQVPPGTSGNPTFSWEQTGGPPLPAGWLADPAVALAFQPGGGRTTAPSLTIAAGVLQAGETYRFRVVINITADNGQSASSFADVEVSVANSAPSGGELIVSPSGGEALTQPFALSTRGWVDAGRGPLQYRFGFMEMVVPSSSANKTAANATSSTPQFGPLLPAGFTALTDWAIDPAATVLLPPPPAAAFGGANSTTLTVVVLAKNALGELASAQKAVVVFTPQYDALGAVQQFAQQALLFGSSESALAAAVAAAAALPSRPGAASAAAANPTTVMDLLSDIWAATEQTPGQAAIAAAAAADAVASMRNDPDFRFAIAPQTRTLRVIRDIAAAAVAPAPPVVLRDVFEALSAIVSAITAPGGPNRNQGRGQALLEAVDAMFASLVTTLEPNQPAVEFSSRSLQLRAQLDSSETLQRLLGETLTAPLSFSAFQPLPSALVAALNASTTGNGGGGGVATLFLSAALDPHDESGSPAAGYLTRLRHSAVSADGSVLSSDIRIADLPVPVRFTVPSNAALLAAQPPRSTECAFWDEAAQRYSTQGCSALPNPRPANHAVSWPQDADLAGVSPRAISAAWTISGPLYNASLCNVTVLDCAEDAESVKTGARPRKVFPDPDDPFGVPAVGCPHGGGAAAQERRADHVCTALSLCVYRS